MWNIICCYIIVLVASTRSEDDGGLILLSGGFQGEKDPMDKVLLFRKEDASIRECLHNVSPYIVEGSLGAYLTESKDNGEDTQSYLLSCGGKGPDNAGKCFKFIDGKWKRMSAMFRQYETGGSGIQLSESNFMIMGGYHIYSLQQVPDGDSEVLLGNKWISGPSLPYGIAHHCAIQIDLNTTMIIGGEIENKASPRTFIYKWNSDTWTSGPELNIGRRHHSCGLHKGKVIITGGVAEGGRTLDVTEVFDPHLNKMFFGPKLNQSISKAAMVALSDEELYLIGGVSSFNNNQSHYRFEPFKFIIKYAEHGHWEKVAPLSDAFYEHSAIRVPSSFEYKCNNSSTLHQVFHRLHIFYLLFFIMYMKWYK